MKIKTSYLGFLFNYFLIFFASIIILIIYSNSENLLSRPNIYLFIFIITLFILFTLIDEIIYRRLFTYYIEENGVKESFTFIFKREKFVPYQNISSVKLKKGFWERILNLGSIEIETSTEKLIIRGISNPEKVYQEIISHTNKKE
ncbi:MAG: PH domain-containing protein [Candidatus Aenigmatarchaeota archaeon]